MTSYLVYMMLDVMLVKWQLFGCQINFGEIKHDDVCWSM